MIVRALIFIYLNPTVMHEEAEKITDRHTEGTFGRIHFEVVLTHTEESLSEIIQMCRRSSLGVARFRFLKSMQMRNAPLFFKTGTILANHSTYRAV